MRHQEVWDVTTRYPLEVLLWAKVINTSQFSLHQSSSLILETCLPKKKHKKKVYLVCKNNQCGINNVLPCCFALGFVLILITVCVELAVF